MTVCTSLWIIRIPLLPFHIESWMDPLVQISTVAVSNSAIVVPAACFFDSVESDILFVVQSSSLKGRFWGSFQGAILLRCSSSLRRFSSSVSSRNLLPVFLQGRTEPNLGLLVRLVWSVVGFVSRRRLSVSIAIAAFCFPWSAIGMRSASCSKILFFVLVCSPSWL